MPKRNMVSKFKKFIFLALAVGISASNILEDNLSFVIKEFQINHPIIQNKLLSQNSFIRLFKKLLSNGHSTGFCQNNICKSCHIFYKLFFIHLCKIVHALRPKPGMSVATLKGPLPDCYYRLSSWANQRASL